MGCCASSQDGLQEAKDGAPRLILVAAGSADALSFDYANVLREGYEAPLTANGKHVGLYWAKPRNAWGHWDYIDLGVSEKLRPLSVKLDGPYLIWNGPHGEFAFDVSMWQLHEGRHLVAVKACAGNPGGPTRMSKDAAGRDFVLHADGTIGPRTAPHLRLGVFVPPTPADARELANAAWNGDLAKIKSLVKKGAEIDGAFSNGHHSALNGAARNGHAEIVGFLLASGCPDIESRCQAPWSVTPLQQAAYHGRAECAKILLAHGASVTSTSGPGCGNQTARAIAEQMKNGQWREVIAAIDDAPPAPVPVPYDRLSISSYMRCHCGEVPQYLLDDSTKAPNQFGTSKWNAATRGPVTLEIKVRGPPIRLAKYALKSANDAPGRDPKTWDLIAVCADGSERVVHAMGSHDRKWPGRWQWREWPCNHDFEASCFRLRIHDNHGDGGCTQLGQLRLFQCGDGLEGEAYYVGGEEEANGMTPPVINVSNARTTEGHGWWPNDVWNLRGECNGKPQWARAGNPRDYIKWDGRRWTLNGCQPKCYFQCCQDTPLPPVAGWTAAEMGVSSMPTLTFGYEKDPAAEDYSPPSSGATEDGPKLVLTSKGSADAIYFENAHALHQKGGALLTLRGGNMAIVPRYDYPRDAGEWSYIELGLGPRDMAMRVRQDGEFLVRVHDERVFDIAHWKYEEGNILVMLRSTASHPGHTRKEDGGRSFIVNSDGTISPQKAQHLVLGAGKPTFSFVPAESPLVCRFQHAKALAAGQQVPLTLASHPGLAVVQVFDTPREAFHEWHYKALGLGPASKAVVASRQGSFFVDKAGWYVCPSMMNVHQGNHTDLVVNRHNHPARIHEEHRKHGGKRPLDFEFHADGSVAPASAPHLRLGCSFPPLGGSAVASEEQYEAPMAEPVQVVLQGVVVEGEVMGVVDKEY